MNNLFDPLGHPFFGKDLKAQTLDKSAEELAQTAEMRELKPLADAMKQSREAQNLWEAIGAAAKAAQANQLNKNK